MISLTTDAVLPGPIWDKVLSTLQGTFFKTFWEIFALCTSVGIMFDQQVESADMIREGYESEPHSIPRNMLGHPQNEALLELMFQSALLTTKHSELDEDQRLELAFNEDANENYNPIPALIKFANYGAIKISEVISEHDETETMLSLMTFLNNAYKQGVSCLEYEDYLIEDD